LVDFISLLHRWLILKAHSITSDIRSVCVISGDDVIQSEEELQERVLLMAPVIEVTRSLKAIQAVLEAVGQVNPSVVVVPLSRSKRRKKAILVGFPQAFSSARNEYCAG
jgi:hypothetical protein